MKELRLFGQPKTRIEPPDPVEDRSVHDRGRRQHDVPAKQELIDVASIDVAYRCGRGDPRERRAEIVGRRDVSLAEDRERALETLRTRPRAAGPVDQLAPGARPQ